MNSKIMSSAQFLVLHNENAFPSPKFDLIDYCFGPVELMRFFSIIVENFQEMGLWLFPVGAKVVFKSYEYPVAYFLALRI